MTRYHPALVTLHWLLAILIVIGLVMGGLFLSKMPNDDPVKLFGLRGNMTVGIAILVLMLIRVVIRLRSESPPHADAGNPLLNTVAALVPLPHGTCDGRFGRGPFDIRWTARHCLRRFWRAASSQLLGTISPLPVRSATPAIRAARAESEVRDNASGLTTSDSPSPREFQNIAWVTEGGFTLDREAYFELGLQLYVSGIEGILPKQTESST